MTPASKKQHPVGFAGPGCLIVATRRLGARAQAYDETVEVVVSQLTLEAGVGLGQHLTWDEKPSALLTMICFMGAAITAGGGLRSM